jgi:Pyruvate:ferredoxin oxidoreductase and related 2-oxoacid:ferredoxin oxidoreductases, beta subunit
VARTTAFHTTEARQIFEEALQKKGCSVVEVISQCPVSYGKMNNMSSAVKMLELQRDNTLPIAAYEKLPEEKRAGKIVRGILHDVEKPEFIDQYQKLVDSLSLQKQDESKKEDKSSKSEESKSQE